MISPRYTQAQFVYNEYIQRGKSLVAIGLPEWLVHQGK